MKYFLFLLLFFFISLIQLPEINAQTKLSQNELEELLNKAEKAMRQYVEVFKNLSAEETKTFITYDKRGNLEETRRIKSNFIVFQSPRNGVINEFRFVTEFNDKTVARKDDEAAKFIEKLSKSDSDKEEWTKIRQEGTRYDGRNKPWGTTLWQSLPLFKLRQFFDFEAVGQENIERHDVWVIAYRQIKPTLLIKARPTKEELEQEPAGIQYNTDISDAFRPTNPLLTGKMWLDAKTGQVFRHEIKVLLNPPQLSKPVINEVLVYEYQPSEFEIFVPKKFVFKTYRIAGSNDKNLTISNDSLLTLEYSKFSRFTTNVENYNLDDKK